MSLEIGGLDDMPKITKNLATVLTGLFPEEDKVNLESGVISIANYMNKYSAKADNTKVRGLEAKVRELESELEKVKEELENKTKMFDDEFKKNNELGGENMFLTNLNMNLGNENNTLLKKNKLLNTTLTSEKNKLKQCQEENKNLKENETILQKKINNLESLVQENNEIIQKYGIMDRANKKIQLEFEELNKTIAQQRETINKCIEDKNALENSINNTSDENRQTIAEQILQIADLNKQITKCNSENAELTKSNTELNNLNVTMLNKLKDLNTTNDKEKADYDKKIQELIYTMSLMYGGLTVMMATSKKTDGIEYVSTPDVQPSSNKINLPPINSPISKSSESTQLQNKKLGELREQYRKYYENLLKNNETNKENDSDIPDPITTYFVAKQFRTKVCKEYGLSGQCGEISLNTSINHGEKIFPNFYNAYTLVEGVNEYIEKMDAVFSEKYESLNKTEKELESCSEKNSGLEASIKKLEGELETCKKSIKAITSENKNAINERILGLTAKLENAEGEKSGLLSEITNLKKQLETMQLTNSELVQENAAAISAKEAAEKSLTEANNKHSHENLELKSKIEGCEEKIKEGIAKLNKILVGDKETTEAEVSAADTHQNNNDNNANNLPPIPSETIKVELIDDIESNFNAVASSLSAKIAELKGQIDACKAELLAKDNEIKKLEASLLKAAPESEQKQLNILNDAIKSISDILNKYLNGTTEKLSSKDLNNKIDNKKNILENLFESLKKELEKQTKDSELTQENLTKTTEEHTNFISLYKSNLKSNIELLLGDAARLEQLYIETKAVIKNINSETKNEAISGGKPIEFNKDKDKGNNMENTIVDENNFTYNTYTIRNDISGILHVPNVAQEPPTGNSSTEDSSTENPLTEDSINQIKTYTKSIFNYIDKLIKHLDGQRTDLNNKQTQIYNTIGEKNTTILDSINKQLDTINNETSRIVDYPVSDDTPVAEKIKDKITVILNKIKDLTKDVDSCKQSLATATAQPPVPPNKTINLAELIESIQKNLPKIVKVPPTPPTPPQPPVVPATNKEDKPRLTISTKENIPNAIEEYTNGNSQASIKHGNNFIYNVDKNDISKGIEQLYTQGGKTYSEYPIYFYLTFEPDSNIIQKVQYSKKGESHKDFDYSELNTIYDFPEIKTNVNTIYDFPEIKTNVIDTFKKLYPTKEDFIKYLQSIVVNIEK